MIQLEKSSRDAIARSLSKYLKDEFDVEVGGLEAVLLLDFISEKLGPHYYNQALTDARAHLNSKLEALGELFFELEKPTKL